MAMRPLATRQEPSLVATALGLAISPVIFCMHISSALFTWTYAHLSASMQLPLRLLVTVLQIADSLICDVLALITKEPGLRAQVQYCQETISSLQITKQAQERQIALLQGELDNLKAERGKVQRKNLELNKKLQRLQTRLSRSSMETGSMTGFDSPTDASAAAAQDAFKPAADAFAQQQAADAGPFAAPGVQYPGPHKTSFAKGHPTAGDYGQVPAKGWYLHACVVMAALGVRWWLLNQTDPLQRKVMLVIIWPAVWAYGGLLTKVFPNSYTLRATLACTCWALLGYVAHEMVSVSVRGRQQTLAAAL